MLGLKDKEGKSRCVVGMSESVIRKILKSKTLSPNVTTGWMEVTVSYSDGDILVKCKDRIITARCKDVIPMAGDTQGLEDNKSSNEDDLYTLIHYLITGSMEVSLNYEDKIRMVKSIMAIGSTALNYDDLARSIMARCGDVIPMARCGDVIPMARRESEFLVGMCEEVIHMAVDTQGLKDNKSRNGDYLFTLRPYYVWTVLNYKDLASYQNFFYKDLARTSMARFTMARSTMARSSMAGCVDVMCKDVIPMARRVDVIPMAGDMRVQVSSMESLPSDIVLDIFSRVPAESVLECKFVCKKWLTLIGGNNFANMHLRRQLKELHGGDDEGNDNLAAMVESGLFFSCCIDDPDEYKYLLFNGGQPSDRISNDEMYIYNQNLKRVYHPPMHNYNMCDHLVGSCNGLVCTFQLHNSIPDPTYICNPLTREYVYLPELVVKKEDIVNPYLLRTEGEEIDMYGHTASGFGYVRSTNEYKVVRIHYLEYDVGNVEVYTLGSGCGWRAVGKVFYRLSTLTGGRGTYANDAIYWISHKEVLAFDLSDEKFRLISGAPPCLQNRECEDICELVTLGRHLCLYMGLYHVEIWSLTESGDSKATWRMEFDIDYEAAVTDPERNFHPVSLTKNGEIIFLYAESVLYCYDTKTTLMKMVSNEASSDHIEHVEAIAHVNTFASLEAIGENSKRYTVCRSRLTTPLDDVIDKLDRVALCEEIDTTCFRLG